MVTHAARSFTEVEYLALERASETKHEFVAGMIVAMAGARPPHNVIAANTTIALGGLVGSLDCVVMTSDQRVHVPTTRLYAYPDVTVACGERRYDDGDPPSLLNPTVLVEVTSDTTEDYDRGTKFLHYQGIDSLREYVVISHRDLRVFHHRRLDTGQWLLTELAGEDAIVELPTLGGTIPLRSLYAKVQLSEGRPG
jgi:Uma2 family endonuclease